MHFVRFWFRQKCLFPTFREEEGQQLYVCFCLSCSTTRFYHDWLAGSGHKATLHFSSTGSTVFLNSPPPPFKSCSRHRKNVFRESGIKAKFWLWIKKEETENLCKKKSSSLAELCCSICVPALRPYWGRQHQNRSSRKKEKENMKQEESERSRQVKMGSKAKIFEIMAAVVCPLIKRDIGLEQWPGQKSRNRKRNQSISSTVSNMETFSERQNWNREREKRNTKTGKSISFCVPLLNGET